MKRFFLTLTLFWLSVSSVWAGGDLSGYVIVYPAGAEAEEGTEIAALVNKAVGMELPVVSDEAPAVKYEILIGRTNRPESGPFYAASPDTFDWRLARKGSKVLVQGGGCWALARAASRLSERVPSKPEEGNIYGEMIFPRDSVSNLRILDDNIWNWGKPYNSPQWEGTGFDCRDEVRVRALLEVVWATMPDIICLQEYSTYMDPLMRPSLEEKGYVLAYPAQAERWNWTPVFYKSDVLTLVDSRYHRYEPEKPWSNHGSKSYCSGTFRHNATGKEFMVINTHLWWKSEKAQPGSNYAREAQMRKIMTAADDYVLAGGGPVFVMGDLNCRFTSKAMKQMIDAGYVPAWDAATVFGDRRGGHHYCFPDGFSRSSTTKDNGRDSIDQFVMFNGGSTEIRTFHRMYAWFLVPVTDHYPNYADIRL